MTVTQTAPAANSDPAPKALPFWQKAPCPSWCAGRVHGVLTPYRERVHASRDRFVVLTTQDPGILNEGEGETGDRTAPAEISVTMRQHYREAEPHLILMLGEEPELTLAEARELADAIRNLVAINEKGERKAADVLPWWQSEQCPAWCLTAHENDDFPGDREHVGGCHYVELTMLPALDGGTASGFFQSYLAVELEQGWREAEARVLIQHAEEWYSMTLAEAAELADDVSALVAAGSEVA